jgi:hypothetical protein
MDADRPEALAPETVVHRLGGGVVALLRLKPREERLAPPGISVFLGGTAAEAAARMRAAFPDSGRWPRMWAESQIVGTATVADIRGAGFDVLACPSRHFANHGKLIHPDGAAGFNDANLERLAQVFQNTPTPKE